MSALPSVQPPQVLAAQQPNDGISRPAQPQDGIPELLRDPKALQQAAMDPRGSREIAPFGTFEAVGQALENGYYTGLEALDFGTLPDGTPAAVFTDQNGQRQAIKLSYEQWSAALNQRSQARMQMAQQLRTQQDVQRLAPAIQQMAKSVEAMVPGYSAFAQVMTERDPTTAFSAVQAAYGAVQAKRADEIQQLQAQIDDFNLQLIDANATKFIETTSQAYEDQALGILNDQSIPQEQRNLMASQVYKRRKTLEYFQGYRPPSARIAQSASFPTFFSSGPGANAEAVGDLVDAAMALLGQTNLDTMSPQMQTHFVVQKAQEAARQFGWGVPFNRMDMDLVAQNYMSRFQMGGRFMGQGGMGREPQVLPQYEQAEQRGQMVRRESEQERARMAQQMEQAKLESERAKGMGLTAQAEQRRASIPMSQARVRLMEAERQYKLAQIDDMESRGELTAAQAQRERAMAERAMTEADIMSGREPGERAAPSNAPERAGRAEAPAAGGGIADFVERARLAGFDVPDAAELNGTVLQEITQRLLEDRTPEGRQRLMAWRDLVAGLRGTR